MSKTYILWQNQREVGPFEEEVVKKGMLDGYIPPTTLAREATSKTWLPLEELVKPLTPKPDDGGASTPNPHQPASPPPLPMPRPQPRLLTEAELLFLRQMNIQRQLKSVVGAVLIALFVPFYGAFYASITLGIISVVVSVPFLILIFYSDELISNIAQLILILFYLVTVVSSGVMAHNSNDSVYKKSFRNLGHD